jgi:beta-galactosidase
MRRLLPLSLLAASLLAARAEDAPDRVTPVNTPVPVAATNPAILPPYPAPASDLVFPMTGDWHFAIARGAQTVNGYQTTAYRSTLFTASSAAGGAAHKLGTGLGEDLGATKPSNGPDAAFDGDNATYWETSPKYPQWVQADLGATEKVTGISLEWVTPEAGFQCKVEGSTDGTSWKTLADKTAAPGIHDGPLSWEPAEIRYLRLTITGGGAGGRCAVWECKVFVERDGQQVVWHAPAMPAEPMAKADAFFAPGFDDAKWATLKVPSNWELSGHSETNYNATDDAVGLYRRTVDVPASFQGKRILWRFDGVFDSAEIYVNGKRAGYHESGYTAFDVDLTGLVEPGKPNLFAVRVCKTTPSTDLDTGDYEALGGIYRDTFLYAVPETHVSDLTVKTTIDKGGDAQLTTDVEVTGPAGRSVQLAAVLTDGKGQPVALGNGTLAVEIGPDGKGKATLDSAVVHPLLWSAEKPNLYKLAFTLQDGGRATEVVEQPFGFRQVTIGTGGILLWNNVPIRCAGMCRHEIYPTLGAALNDEVWLKDITLMHEANVNAIRTSHYNFAARFLDLCDAKGFYLLDEIPFCWIARKVDDPFYIPGAVQRARETLARDKNRPSVLAWSCGNENPLGKIQPPVLAEVHRLDPTRPAFVTGLWPSDLKGQDFGDGHYPAPKTMEDWTKRMNGRAPLLFTEQPHIFWQKTWRVDYDPGVSTLWEEVLDKSWTTLNRYPPIFGSYIWEWQDQPVLDFFQHDGGSGKGMRWDNLKGMVTGVRDPKPEYWAVKMSYSQVRITSDHVTPSGATCEVSLDNRYSFTDLKELGCAWEILNGDQVLQKGTQVIECAPRQSATVQFPALPKMTALHLTFTGTDGANVVDAILKTKDAPVPLAPLFAGKGGKLESEEGDGGLRLHNDLAEVRFDKATGQLSGWRFKDQDLITGPTPFNLGQWFPNDEGGATDHLNGPGPLTLSGATWKTEAQGDAMVVTATAAAAFGKENKPLGTLTTVYTVTPDARITVRWTLQYTGAAIIAWDIGEKFALPERLKKLAWSRDARFLYYPPNHMGAPEGSCASDDIRFRASKRDLHWLTLTDEKGAGLALLPLDQVPLVGRGGLEAGKTLLWASLDISAPHDLSHPWAEEHDVHLDPAKPLSGGFMLCPVAAGNP